MSAFDDPSWARLQAEREEEAAAERTEAAAPPPPPLADVDVLQVVNTFVTGCFDRGWSFTVDISTPATGAEFHLTTPGARS